MVRSLCRRATDSVKLGPTQPLRCSAVPACRRFCTNCIAKGQTPFVISGNASFSLRKKDLSGHGKFGSMPRACVSAESLCPWKISFRLTRWTMQETLWIRWQTINRTPEISHCFPMSKSCSIRLQKWCAQGSQQLESDVWILSGPGNLTSPCNFQPEFHDQYRTCPSKLQSRTDHRSISWSLVVEPTHPDSRLQLGTGARIFLDLF